MAGNCRNLLGWRDPGAKVGTLNLGSWANGSLLYILWADDNAAADRNNANSEEGGYTIHNFVASVGGVEPPAITQQPVSITVTQGFGFQLTVAASGLGVQYQLYRGGAAIDAASNPTATQPTLVITNASLSDDNLYEVTASNGGGTATSTEVHVTVIADTIPPVLVSANEDPVNTQLFYLRVNEPLCVDGNSCGSSAADAANWAILSLDESEDLGVASVTVNGTNLTLQAGFPRDPAKVYKIVVSPAGIRDRGPIWQFHDGRRLHRSGTRGCFPTERKRLCRNARHGTPWGSAGCCAGLGGWNHRGFR